VAGAASRGTGTLVLTDIPSLEDFRLPPGYAAFFARHDIRHLAAAPVRADEQGLGALVVCRVGESSPYDDATADLLARVADVASFAVERSALLARVHSQSEILDRIADAVIVVDEARVVTKWNHGSELLYGISKTEALGQPLADLVSTVSVTPTELSASWQKLRSQGVYHEAVRQITRHGKVVEVDAMVTPIVDDETGFSGAVAVNRDISARLHAQQEVAERQAFADAVLDALPGRTLVLGADGRVRAVNRRCSEEGPLGEGPGTGPDVGADGLAYLDLRAHTTSGLGVLAARVREILAGGDGDGPIEVSSESGNWTTCEVVPFRGPGRGALLSFSDATDRKTHELELVHLATHDTLTTLPNRGLLLDRLQEALMRAHRQRDHVAVLYLDLDDFKTVNDSLGHHAGDRMLVDVAARLAGACRGCDTVARVGGDEFVIALEQIRSETEAAVLASRVLAALGAGGERTAVSASIGMVVRGGLERPTPADAEDLVHRADLAMLRAKRGGKARVATQADLPEQPYPG